jgi:26S proteasome regulatory subunit N1
LAYAGSAREDLLESLSPVIEDSSANMEVVSIAGLALGLIFVGTANPDITQAQDQLSMV